MTLTLEIPSDVETQLRADADRAGVPLETLAFARLTGAAPNSSSRADRVALARSLRGRAKGRGPTVDEFLAERSAEGRAEAGL